MAALGSFGLLGGPDLFGGMTPYGFDIPQSDPHSVATAAARLRSLGAAFAEQGKAIGAAASAALDGGAWGGAAAAAYASYSGHVASICSTDTSACDSAASVLSSFANELAHAQAVTQQARADCDHYQSELNKQQGLADQAGQAAQTALLNASFAPHPTATAEFHRQAHEAQQQQASAQAASAAAENEFEAAKRRGRQASDAYRHEAQAVTGRLNAAGSELRPVPTLPGGAPAPITPSKNDLALAASVNALARRGQVNGPLVDSVPASDRTPGFILALLQTQRDRTPPPPPEHHGGSFLGALLPALATGVLTVVDVAQLGLDPVTDAATVATGAATVEAVSGGVAETVVAADAAATTADAGASADQLYMYMARGRYDAAQEIGRLPAGADGNLFATRTLYDDGFAAQNELGIPARGEPVTVQVQVHPDEVPKFAYNPRAPRR